MHVFVSDIHMTDTDTGGVVSDSHLTSFADRILRIADEQQREKVTLVMVGDIFDLLRSPKWATLWKEKGSAPWSGMAPKFKQFKKSFAETQALEILNDICKRYPQFSAKVRELVKANLLETVYIPGNHDFMVQLSPDLRQLVVDFLSLTVDPKKAFKTTYENKAASVFALHGNSFDPANWHREAEGYWAIGDAIVLLVVNRFPEEACRLIGCAPHTEIGQLLQEVDNVQPLVDIPIWVRWLTENNLTIKASRDKVIKAWKQVVDEFLSVEDFKDKAGYGKKDYQIIRQAFELSTRFGLARLIGELAKYFPNIGTDYRLAAETEAKKFPEYRFVLFGHTHKPMLQPLTFGPEGQSHFYVNTGCWRRLVMRSAGQGLASFAARRVTSYFVIDEARKASDEELQERYHLFQEWHTS